MLQLFLLQRNEPEGCAPGITDWKRRNLKVVFDCLEVIGYEVYDRSEEWQGFMYSIRKDIQLKLR